MIATKQIQVITPVFYGGQGTMYLGVQIVEK
jgi:hypothetical protein